MANFITLPLPVIPIAVVSSPTTTFQANLLRDLPREDLCSYVRPMTSSTLANFMRAHLYASVGVLKIGNDILFNEEKIKVDRITGHGGLFRTKGVGQRVLAAAINSPISVMETAGEGGAWGIALLGSYLVNNKKGQSLAMISWMESVFGQRCWCQRYHPHPKM